ncbi:hypothetical protein L3Q82_015205 [Scortum barcoo]|uniref:Uncharacterized protein n=1 Tax=Scortum barcoo TaxID=214431 RepID=A0ACB8VTI2_9TELE|nr:hypothetical protein L3Q82_015205 [Scortum barcoo]
MGAKQGKTHAPPPEGPIGGGRSASLSQLALSQIAHLEAEINKREAELLKNKRMKVEDLYGLASHRRCLKMWKDEAEKRERRKTQRGLSKERENIQKDSDKNVDASQAVSLCPSLPKVDPDLDACPPPYAPQPEPQSPDVPQADPPKTRRPKASVELPEPPQRAPTLAGSLARRTRCRGHGLGTRRGSLHHHSYNT